MFHLYITIAFIVPNIYVFFRIKNLFISKPYRLWYSILYVLLIAIYPIAESFSRVDSNIVMRAVSTISGYILPFFLYLFLSVILLELFLLFNKWVKVVSLEVRKSFLFRFYLLSAMIILSMLVVVGGVINLNTIRVSEYKIEVPKRNSKIDHLRVVFVADMHVQQTSSIQFVKQFVRKVNALQLDIMLYGGDMVEGHSNNETTDAIDSVLRSVKAKYGSYGVLGNHEFYGGQQLDGFFQKAGISLLLDTLVNIDNSFFLIGRLDQHFKGRKTINDILGNDALDLPAIVLDHRPTELAEVSQTAVNVQFSGHTHNGQLFPLNLIMRSMYDLSWGHKLISNTHFFVTSGLRLWGPPVKTAGKSEIMLVDIYFK